MKSITWMRSDLAHTVPLAVLNAAQGINISTSLTVVAAATGISSAVGSLSSPSTTTGTSTCNRNARHHQLQPVHRSQLHGLDACGDDHRGHHRL